MPKPVGKTTSYEPGLDGLRALAVIAVFIYHVNTDWLPGGLLGVAVFFTLSGWLITGGLLRDWRNHKQIRFLRFWGRRFRRLLPAMLVVVAATTLAVWLADRENFSDVAAEAGSSLLYVNNWYNIFFGDSYFDQFGPASPLGHMWSLSVEEQFYLIWPLLLGGIIAATRGLSRHRAKSVMLAAALAIMVASFAAMWLIAEPGWDNTRVYEGTDTRAGGLLAGAALAIALFHVGPGTPPQHRNRYLADALGIAGLVTVVVLFVVGDENSLFLYRGGIIALTVATCALVYAVQVPGTLSKLVFSLEPLRWVGERSYGIYLWHMPIIALTPIGWAEDNRPLSVALQAALTIALAAASWRLVEDPIRTHGLASLGLRRKPKATGPTIGEVWGLPAGTMRPRAPKAPDIKPAVAWSGVMVLVLATATSLTSLRAAESFAQEREPGAAAPGGGGGAAEEEAARPEAEAAEPSTEDEPEPTATSCTAVVHVGDSTSIGMYDDQSLPDPADHAEAAYLAAGADYVRESVFGPRATTDGWNEYPSTVDSVKQLLAEGQPEGTCWVINTGVNDAANVAVGSIPPVEERIRIMLDLLDGQRVMWPTTVSDTESGPWAQANMREFNEALLRVQKDYPNLRVFDWAAEVDHAWFLEGDFVHYNATGNAERSHRFAGALVRAFPEGKKTSDAPVVSSGR